ncbi:MAG: cation-transporting P-type ATPase [Spirochaetes bacterium]|nr:cation-transporting P-type ATPase [Spirochaetota bacterium]
MPDILPNDTAEKTDPFHHQEGSAVCRQLGVDPKLGLTGQAVTERQHTYGLNALTRKRNTPPVVLFLMQFNQPLVVILIVAATVTAVLKELVDSLVIFGVVFVNAVIGFVQEYRARNAIDALARAVTKEATVLRDGIRRRIDARDLTVGDIVLLQSGDQVPADLRLIAVRDCSIDESALTGESVAVEKTSTAAAPDAVLAERTCMAYASTYVTYGTATGTVTAVGDATEIGKINAMISNAVSLETPLTRLLGRLSMLMLYVILGLAAVTFAVGIYRGSSVIEMFMASVALAVGAIPEGLPAALTITLAIGVSTMARRHAIIRKLPAVETLGSTTVICSDKTGTLTQNQMTVVSVWTDAARYEVTGVGYTPEGAVMKDAAVIRAADIPVLERIFAAGTLCNDSRLVQKDGRWIIEGDPTEGALIVAAEKAGVHRPEYERRHARIDAIPFESQYQYMATLHETGGTDRICCVKGSVESILARAELTDAGREAIHTAAASYASGGLRVLALAEKRMPPSHGRLAHQDIESGLTFLGLQAMIDPPRPEAVAAVADCRRAGISVKMITGDHELTAFAIAQKIGIVVADAAPKDTALNGKKIAAMSDGELTDVVKTVSVFARVSPEDKLRLVRALQHNGNVVAMTGDGVNDAPSLKQADIGVAMGITGTDVAKESADMVLTDDNFATIKAAVEEGRGVYDNLVKFITWTLPTNFGEGLVILIAVIMGIALPILPVQILWINMTTAILLGLMLAFEPKEPGIMERPPRAPGEPILTKPLIARIITVGSLLCASSFIAYEIALSRGEPEAAARTIAVNIFVFGEIFYLFNCRSLRLSVFSVGMFSNPPLWLGVLLMLLLQIAFTYVPFMNTAFHSAPISLIDWGMVIGASSLIMVIVAAEKFIRNRLRKRRPVSPHVR